MELLNAQTIANSLVIMGFGGWVMWVTRGLTQNRKDIDAAHRKLRGNERDRTTATDQTSMEK